MPTSLSFYLLSSKNSAVIILPDCPPSSPANYLSTFPSYQTMPTISPTIPSNHHTVPKPSHLTLILPPLPIIQSYLSIYQTIPTRVGNLLISFSSDSLVFCERKSDIHEKEWIAPVVLLYWATWANRSWLLFCYEQPKRITHGHFFVKSDGSEMLKSLKKKNEQRAIGAIRSWA